MDLLERHRPWLRYDSQESFSADSVRAMVGAPGARLHRPGAEARPARLDALAPGEGAGEVLDLPGRDYVRLARSMHGRPGIGDVVHGRMAEGAGGRTWLQYWLFYVFNDKAFLGFGLHEGDWEMVAVLLDGDDRLEAMTFNRHREAARALAGQVELRDGAPVIYVAKGSHASHPRAGRYRAPVVPDSCDGRGRLVRPRVERIDGATPGWSGWLGRWGSTRPRVEPVESWSPQGPVTKEAWKHPDEWHAEARPAEQLPRAPLGPPAPTIQAQRRDGRARVTYAFGRMARGVPAPVTLLVSVDCADDDMPPATYRFPVEGRSGAVAHPLELSADRRYLVRASAWDEDGGGSPVVRTTLPPTLARGG